MRSIWIFVCLLLVSWPTISYAKCKTVMEVAAEQSKYKHTTAKLCGTIEISTHYRYTYSKAMKTHIAYRLIDHTGTAYLYAKRKTSGGERLMRQVVKNGGKVYGDFFVKVRWPVRTTKRLDLWEQPGSFYGELIGYRNLQMKKRR